MPFQVFAKAFPVLSQFEIVSLSADNSLSITYLLVLLDQIYLAVV